MEKGWGTGGGRTCVYCVSFCHASFAVPSPPILILSEAFLRQGNSGSEALCLCFPPPAIAFLHCPTHLLPSLHTLPVPLPFALHFPFLPGVAWREKRQDRKDVLEEGREMSHYSLYSTCLHLWFAFSPTYSFVLYFPFPSLWCELVSVLCTHIFPTPHPTPPPSPPPATITTTLPTMPPYPFTHTPTRDTCHAYQERLQSLSLSLSSLPLCLPMPAFVGCLLSDRREGQAVKGRREGGRRAWTDIMDILYKISFPLPLPFCATWKEESGGGWFLPAFWFVAFWFSSTSTFSNARARTPGVYAAWWRHGRQGTGADGRRQ